MGLNMKNSKKLIVGGTNDFGKKICELMQPNAEGIGRSNEFDISSPEARNQIVKMSTDYDILLLLTFGDMAQSTLAEKLAIHWIDQKHDGHLIVIGTTAIFHDKFDRPKDQWGYLREKSALQTLGKYASKKAANAANPFRYTTLHVGRLDNIKAKQKSNSTNALQAQDVYEAIEFVATRPKNTNIHELYIDPKY